MFSHKIEVVTEINAPVQICFDLARSVRTHEFTARSTGETAVSSSGNDLLELGDEVDFIARHVGLKWKLRAKIVEMSSPGWFVDEQVAGPFAYLRYEHRFENDRSATKMTDTITFSAPYGPIGFVVGRFLLLPHLRRFLIDRNAALKALAEETS